MKTTIFLGIIGLLILAACTAQNTATAKLDVVGIGDAEPPAPAWRTAVLTDALTGQTYTIDSLPKPLLVESFAVWCPTCLKQQQIMGNVDSATHLSIDTDPNEDDATVKEHAEKHGLDWLFTVSSSTVTQSLIDEFGIGVVNAPSVPVILVCEDGARLLDRGLKQEAELRAEIAAGCAA